MNRGFGTIVGAAVVALLVVAAGVLGALTARPATTQAAPAPTETRRTITVVGNGSIKAVPDTANVEVGVVSEAATASQALADNSTKMQALVDKLKGAGLADKDIRTSNINISPIYDDKGHTVTGYRVNNSVAVKIRDIAKTSGLLDKVVETGANNIYGIGFNFDDPASLQATARTTAINDAHSRADAMAKASNATLGQVLSITENVGSSPPIPMAAGTAMSDAAPNRALPPIQAGETTINAEVQITYELK